MYPATRSTAAATHRPAVPPRRLTAFFPVMALLLLAAVLAGFWNTFYARPADTTPLALHLHVHGIVLTAWFVVFALQSLLVAGGRVALHRQLGVVAAGVAMAVVATSLVTLVQLVPGWRAAGIDVDARRPLVGLIIWGDLGALAAYVVFLVRGLLLRRRPESHRRMMLLASLAIISPALIRLSGLPVFAGIDGVLITIGGLLALSAMLVLYDLVSLRRLHHDTLWGVPFFLVVHLAPAFVMPGTALDA